MRTRITLEMGNDRDSPLSKDEEGKDGPTDESDEACGSTAGLHAHCAILASTAAAAAALRRCSTTAAAADSPTATLNAAVLIATAIAATAADRRAPIGRCRFRSIAIDDDRPIFTGHIVAFAIDVHVGQAALVPADGGAADARRAGPVGADGHRRIALGDAGYLA